jgi:hypothetical protein
MKTNILIILLLISIASIAQSKKSKVTTSTLKVYGNCGMCKERIETSLDYKGIKTATWDPATKDLVVTYNPSKINEQKICERVAEVGHDTDKVKARDEVYAKLPFCCLYRDHDHKGMEDDHKHNHPE